MIRGVDRFPAARDGARRRQRLPPALAAIGLLAPALALLAALAGEEQQASREQGEAAKSKTFLLSIPLPVAGEIDTHVKRRIDQLLAALPPGRSRSTLILEFRPKAGQAGEGSEFERCLSLARYLASDRLSGLRTVAYVPSSVRGHAVLPVIACEEMILHPDAELGEAGLNEAFIDPTMRRGYGEIAERRRTVPAAIALGMLDKGLAVYRVQTLDGPRYVLEEELAALRKDKSTTISSVEAVVRAGDMARFTGRDLRLKYGFASHLARDRSELAAALQVPVASMEEDPSWGGRWRAVRADLQGPVSPQLVGWVERSIRERLEREEVNFLCLWIDSPGGAPLASLRLANFLASLNPSEVRTVAYVPAQARADAALIALACDHLVMADEATIGGPGAVEMADAQRSEIRRAIQAMAKEKHRDWSLPVALIDPGLAVYRCTREGTGEVRYFSAEELEELGRQEERPAAWVRGGEIEARRGLSGRKAEEVGLARYLAGSLDEFKQLYHLGEELDFLRPNWAHLLVEQLASPKIAGVLLFVAWFALLAEFSQPGVGIPGFVSAVCFVIYFWSQFLHGTAGWLEILLFLAGVLSVLVEILVIPGFGIFGLGGAVLIIASIVLASQTFVIPSNAYQLGQLPRSLMMVAAAGAGAFASLVLMRRYLADAPVVKRLMLAPVEEEDRELLARREALADYGHLRGKRGKTVTPLTPSGKAQFGDALMAVMSDGELIPAGTEVFVSDVVGTHVYVQRVPGKEA